MRTFFAGTLVSTARWCRLVPSNRPASVPGGKCGAGGVVGVGLGGCSNVNGIVSGALTASAYGVSGNFTFTLLRTRLVLVQSTS